MPLPDLAALVAVAGLVVLLLGTAVTRHFRASLGLALEFFLAAAVMRLTGDRDFQVIVVAALVVLVWRLARSVVRVAT